MLTQSDITSPELLINQPPLLPAELGPAAVREEQRVGDAAVQLGRRPGGFPPADRGRGAMAPAAAAGTRAPMKRILRISYIYSAPQFRFARLMTFPAAAAAFWPKC